MKGKRVFLLGAFVFVIAALFAASLIICPVDASAKVYRMKIQSAYPRGDVSMELLEEFAKSADKRSNGQIKISVFADPELVPAEQLFDLVADPGEQNNLFGKGQKAEAELAKELDRLSTEAQKYSRAAEQRSIDGATQERLKALGYVD